MAILTGLAPIYSSENTRVLILGSMPGQRSLELGQYYGHAQNGFWPIMANLLSTLLPNQYEERLEMLKSNGFGLWDVVKSCEREGSSDASISNVEANDILSVAAACKNLDTIAFNGKKAWQLFCRYIGEGSMGRIRLIQLPSTSPANAMLSKEKKEKIWRERLFGFLPECDKP